MSEFKYQRLPAKDIMIKDISPDKDVRIRITGTIISKSNTAIIVDDSSANTEIITPIELTKDFKQGDIVRVFCRVTALEKGYQLQAEIIQDMSELDIEKYRKII
ncbi:hypothetical protein CL614_01005 [archaeon]|nr:hypothetical protein [archaeon]|tara:strand:- start:42 stop:353 length:312 start_codon:yes stop_codon:yes gene_type:complete